MDEGQLVRHRRARSRLPSEVDVVHVSRDYLSNKESLIRLDKHAAVCIHHTSPFKVVLSRTLRIELDDNWRSGESNHSVISICKQGNCRWFKHPHKIVDNQKSDLNGALNHSVEKREVKIEIASAADFNIWI